MPHYNDDDLLEEIKYDRNQTNNSSSRGSLVSLFENDKSAVFTPSAFTTVMGTILCAIVVGTLWWQGVNNKIDTFQQNQNSLIERVNEVSVYQKNQITTLHTRATDLREEIRNLKTVYDTDTKFFRTTFERDILTLTASINDLTKDSNDLHKQANEMEKQIREIEFNIERLKDMIGMTRRN